MFPMTLFTFVSSCALDSSIPTLPYLKASRLLTTFTETMSTRYDTTISAYETEDTVHGEVLLSGNKSQQIH